MFFQQFSIFSDVYVIKAVANNVSNYGEEETKKGRKHNIKM